MLSIATLVPSTAASLWRIEETWIGDLIGVVSLALLVAGAFWLASAFSLPTGAEQLIQEVR